MILVIFVRPCPTIMKIQIHADKLTDSPYAESNKNAFLFDDEVALDQFSLELRHGHAGAYLISGYRGSGKTSFINRLQEKMSDVIFVELNIAKTVSYPILVKRVIRQLFLQYQAYCDRTKSKPGEFMDEFQLLYDRTFNDIINVGLQSREKERERAQIRYSKIININLETSWSSYYFNAISICDCSTDRAVLFAIWQFIGCIDLGRYDDMDHN
jgi:ABC-type methionine transport system ATPase subunit